MEKTIEVQQSIDQARLLISRLERLSADSVWAHRASGVRGALLKLLDRIEEPIASPERAEFDQLQACLAYGFTIVENAARELLR